MINSRVRQRLGMLSPQHAARLQTIEAQVTPLLEYAQGGRHLTFTTHGLSHVSAVERNYDWLLTDSDLELFNAAELFTLICATFFHDAFMAPKSIDDTTAREEHIDRAVSFLMHHRDSLNLSLHEADAVSQVVRAHGVERIEAIPQQVVIGSEIVDLRKLGACLSLADLAHADSSRAPEILLKHLDLDETSQWHWRRHLQISGLTRKDDTILMSALTFSDFGREAVEEYKRSIEEQLNTVQPYFSTSLAPIKRVELLERRLESPLQQVLQFQTNTPAILKLLIEGVYDREDVFIRELVQNSLDSCLVRKAKQQRRNLPYEPRVLLTTFHDQGRLRAFRVDDNGIGMDLTDVQDTVLWIGSSISSRSDVIELLQQTIGKSLIATFGIGLLSCFKASEKITVRTHKEAETPLEFELTSVSHAISPKRGKDTSVGTTLIVEIPPAKADQIDTVRAIEYYFRMVQQVDLRSLRLEEGPDLYNASREHMFRIAVTEAKRIPVKDYFAPARQQVGIELKGEEFSGALWLPYADVGKLVDTEGKVEILNEGIFVTTEPSTDWFPEHIEFCEGVLNFSSRAISLPAGRDRVIKDSRFRAVRRELVDKSHALVDQLVRRTASPGPEKRDFAALILSLMYSRAERASREKILRRMSDYHLRVYTTDSTVTVAELLSRNPKTVFLQYPKGKWVSDLTKVDGKQLYHKEDDLVELQAALLAQDGQVVITAVRSDEKTQVLEATLLTAVFQSVKLGVVDLLKERTSSIAQQKFASVPISVEAELKPFCKFVEVEGLPNKRAWLVGSELWVNIANPRMRKVFEYLRGRSPIREKKRMAHLLFLILAYKLEDALSLITQELE